MIETYSMLRRSLSLVLAATIATCPFFCRLNGAIAKAAGKSPHPCCDCCHSDHSSGQTQRSDGSDRCPPNSGKSCQCICGGAISELGNAVDIALDVSMWSILP